MMEKYEKSIKKVGVSYGMIKKDGHSENIELIFYKNRDVFREVIEIDDGEVSFLFEFWVSGDRIDFKQWPI